LILLAWPKILEELDRTLDNKSEQKITHRLAKNLIEFKKHEVKKYLKEHLE
jgi:protein required for attachment to host cells